MKRMTGYLKFWLSNVWKGMGHRLQTKVIGQDKPLKQWHINIRRNRAGFDERAVNPR